jgi:hypothetical protein
VILVDENWRRHSVRYQHVFFLYFRSKQFDFFLKILGKIKTFVGEKRRVEWRVEWKVRILELHFGIFSKVFQFFILAPSARVLLFLKFGVKRAFNGTRWTTIREFKLTAKEFTQLVFSTNEKYANSSVVSLWKLVFFTFFSRRVCWRVKYITTQGKND